MSGHFCPGHMKAFCAGKGCCCGAAGGRKPGSCRNPGSTIRLNQYSFHIECRTLYARRMFREKVLYLTICMRGIDIVINYLANCMRGVDIVVKSMCFARSFDRKYWIYRSLLKSLFKTTEFFQRGHAAELLQPRRIEPILFPYRM